MYSDIETDYYGYICDTASLNAQSEQLSVECNTEALPDFSSFYKENKTKIKKLSRGLFLKEDYDLLDMYHVCGLNQDRIGTILGRNGYYIGLWLRCLMAAIGALLMGVNKRAGIARVLNGAGLDRILQQITTTNMIVMYARVRDFKAIGKVYRVRHSKIRKALVKTATALKTSNDPEARALACIMREAESAGSLLCYKHLVNRGV